jgi:hypothetical protein
MAMPNSRQPDVKLQALRQTRTVNAKAEQVSDPLFQQHAFFDPRDVVQV